MYYYGTNKYIFVIFIIINTVKLVDYLILKQLIYLVSDYFVRSCYSIRS